MVYKTASDVLKSEYIPNTVCKFSTSFVDDGLICVMIVTTQQGYDVWNVHGLQTNPLRKGWQKVYTLEHCNPEEQVVQSLAALKRLFEN